MQRNYESMIILTADLDEGAKGEIISRITEKIEGSEGKVSASKEWAKNRHFYYPIKGRGAEKKKYTEGCYWLINFTLDAARLPDLKELFRLEERVLRNIIIRREK